MSLKPKPTPPAKPAPAQSEPKIVEEQTSPPSSSGRADVKRRAVPHPETEK